MRTSLTRSQLREALSTGSGLPVMLDIGDNISTLLGKPYSGDLREWVAAGKMVGVDVNCLVGEADWLPSSHALGRRRRVVEENSGRKVVEIIQPTPLGDLTAIEIEEPGQKPARTQMFLREEADYAKAIALLRALRESRADITSHVASKRRIVGEDGLLTIFIPQPLEMHFLVLHGDMILHQLDWPETYAAAMAEVRETSNMVIDCAADAGADMIMFGGAGTEVFSPDMIEQGIIEPAVIFAEHCRARGLFSLMHCCGRTRILHDQGWIARVHPTIFESFTPAPLGDIPDVAAAAKALPPDMFFKGGLELERLLCGTAAECAAMTRSAWEAHGQRRYILAGTCAILTGTPAENLRAVTATAALCQR